MDGGTLCAGTRTSMVGTPGCDGAAWKAGSPQEGGAAGTVRRAGALRGEGEARSSVIRARLREG